MVYIEFTIPACTSKCLNCGFGSCNDWSKTRFVFIQTWGAAEQDIEYGMHRDPRLNNQSINFRWTDQFVRQLINKSVHELINQSIFQIEVKWINYRLMINYFNTLLIQYVNQYIYQINQWIDQSSSQSTIFRSTN